MYCMYVCMYVCMYAFSLTRIDWVGLVVLVELALLSLWSYLTFRLPIASPEGDNLTFSYSTVSSHTPNSSVDYDSIGNDEQVCEIST